MPNGKRPDKPLDCTDKRVALALTLAFEGRWTHVEGAKRCGVATRTYEYWLVHPDFQSALEAKRADFAASIRDVAYADKARRILALDAMGEAARREFEARPWLKEVRPTKEGEVVNEHFNADAHAAFRGALDDIAKELGERASNVKVSGGLTHSLVPAGEVKAIADEMLDAVRDMPDARAALGLRLLASGE